MGQSAAELRREIEDVRGNMSRDLDAIGDRVSPRRMAERRVARTRRWASSARDRVFGAADHTMGRASSGMHDVTDSLGGAAHGVVARVEDAPHLAARQARGNPMAAGAVAFGVGFLAAAVFGPTETEQRVVGDLADKAQPLIEPVKEQLGDAAHQVAETVREHGQEAVQELRDDARERASNVQSTAHQVVDDTRNR